MTRLATIRAIVKKSYHILPVSPTIHGGFALHNGSSTVGKRFKTREEVEQWQRGIQAHDARKFRKELHQMDSNHLNDQANYWLKK